MNDRDSIQHRYNHQSQEDDKLVDDQLISSSKHERIKFVNEMQEYLKPPEDIIDRHADSEIASFYDGRSIFLTGASGFVGKCILEKLLRSCPKVKEIFILMRPKRGRDVGERVEMLLRSELFDRLKKLPDGLKQMEKVRPVKGDITKPLFGLSEENINLLASRVTILFHSAATVKFEEALRVAVYNNVVSVENLIEVASRLTQLEALVHVSTAYSNCDRTEVDEIFYETPIQADRLIEMSHWMKDKVMDCISPELLASADRPNTYTYTKAVAESLVAERAAKLLPNLPIAVVRPSIVAGIWDQPIRGWVDNFNGPTGVMLAMMSGSLQAVHVYPNYCADIVPVDMVANLIICSAWQIKRRQQSILEETRRRRISGRRVDVVGSSYDHVNTPGCRRDGSCGGVASQMCNNDDDGDQDECCQDSTKTTLVKSRKQQQQENLSEREIKIIKSDESQETKHILMNKTNDYDTSIINNGTSYDRPDDNNKLQQITIFNCVSGSLNPLSWRDFCTSLVKMAYKYPINAAIRQPGTLLISNGYLFRLYNLIDHSAFAHLGDLLLKLFGQKPKLVTLHNRLMKMINTLEPFTTKQWVFNCSNTSGLYNDMSPLDKKIFNFDLTQVSWTDYLERYYVGSKVFALKDDPLKMFGTKRRLKLINISSKFAQIMIMIMAYYYLIMGTSIEANAIDSLLEFGEQFRSTINDKTAIYTNTLWLQNGG